MVSSYPICVELTLNTWRGYRHPDINKWVTNQGAIMGNPSTTTPSSFATRAEPATTSSRSAPDAPSDPASASPLATSRTLRARGGPHRQPRPQLPRPDDHRRPAEHQRADFDHLPHRRRRSCRRALRLRPVPARSGSGRSGAVADRRNRHPHRVLSPGLGDRRDDAHRCIERLPRKSRSRARPGL